MSLLPTSLLSLSQVAQQARRLAKVPLAQSTLPATKRLLVIEVFAGSHPVGRHCKALQEAQQQAPYSIAAYAAVELVQPQGDKYKAPSPTKLNLPAEHCLSLSGADIQDPDVVQQLVQFVRSSLRTASPSAVVVFGGLPCTKYCNAGPHYWRAKAQRDAAWTEYKAAAKQLHLELEAVESVSLPESQSVADLHQGMIAAEAQLAQAEKALRKFTEDLRTADDLVQSFLDLFKEIEQECKKPREAPCHLAMENPYSCAEKGLWNR